MHNEMTLAAAQINVLEDQVEKCMQDVTKAHQSARGAYIERDSMKRMYDALAEEASTIHTMYGQRLNDIQILKNLVLSLHKRKPVTWRIRAMYFISGILFLGGLDLLARLVQ